MTYKHPKPVHVSFCKAYHILLEGRLEKKLYKLPDTISRSCVQTLKIVTISPPSDRRYVPLTNPTKNNLAITKIELCQ